MEIQFVFSIIILLFSVVIHEVSHGYAALFLGDRTAEYEGRLTLNPIKHIDLFGTIIIPLVMFLLPGGLIFGWAKPVPYNPRNLHNQRWGEAIVAVAGPFSNILIAFVFGLFIRFYIVPNDLVSESVGVISQMIVLVNIVLAIFNLVPIPPLDGSKVLSAILPSSFFRLRQSMEQFGFFAVIIFLLFFWQFFMPVIPWFFGLITGVGL